MTIDQIYAYFLTCGQKITTDSRHIEKGQIFFALKGPSFDGNTFALEALRLGARFAVVDQEDLAGQHGIIYVSDVLTTLQELALFHRRQLNIPIIAITGSNGKTTSKELIREVLKQKFKVAYTQGNLNNHIGVPLTLLSIKAYEDIAIIEMGANHVGEIASYCTYTEPNYGVITNIGKAHLEGFGGIEGVIKGKTELYRDIASRNGLLFVNKDDKILNEKSQGIRCEYYSTSSIANISGKIITNPSHNYLCVNIQDHEEQMIIETHLTGDYNLSNILCAYTIGRFFDIPMEAIQAGIDGYMPTNHRSQVISFGSYQVIMDAYNANPSSMHVALENLAKKSGRKIAIIGAMKELGDEANAEHLNIVSLVDQLQIDLAIFVGTEYEQAAKKYPQYAYVTGYQDAKTWMDNQILMDSTILIKGSRGMTLEKILD